MEDQIITLYVLCDELLQALGHKDHPQSQMSSAEVMTTALVATHFFGGNYEHSRALLKAWRLIPNMLTKSRFCRRLQAIPESYWQDMLGLLFEASQHLKPTKFFRIDSFPIAVCDNIRIKSCRIYHEEKYRGKVPSKRRYIYGLRIHLVIAGNGQPIDFCLAPASEHDCKVWKRLHLEVLPPGSEGYVDSAYTDYEFEDFLQEAGEITFYPMRKSNSRRPFSKARQFIQLKLRQGVEVVGSLLERKRPAHLHAVTSRGFELKVALQVILYAFNNFAKLLAT